MKQIHNVIKKPIISEKSFAEAGRGRYSFIVATNANKTAIKLAVEEMFGVTVVGVATNIVKGSKMRFTKKGRNLQDLTYKKARVQLAKDQKIDIFEEVKE
ncbi:MAG TPA: 50S ribosomal protein L23 [Candidatus Levybacteria bacterium]|nr:50S ribosomal protein L23 [Candidatus Levybacteria bacterium]